MESEVMHGKDNATYQATEFHGREGRYQNRTGNQKPPKLWSQAKKDVYNFIQVYEH